jgi:hypothetical protein
MDHPDIAQLTGAPDERIEQHRRRGRGAMDIDLVAAPDPGNGLVSWDDAHQGRDDPTAGGGPWSGVCVDVTRGWHVDLDIDESIGPVGDRDIRPLEFGPHAARPGDDDPVGVVEAVDRPGLEGRVAFSGAAIENLDVIPALASRLDDDCSVVIDPDDRLARSARCGGSAVGHTAPLS